MILWKNTGKVVKWCQEKNGEDFFSFSLFWFFLILFLNVLSFVKILERKWCVSENESKEYDYVNEIEYE